jgi:hypothetical protein
LAATYKDDFLAGFRAMNETVTVITPPVPDFWTALADGLDTQKADAFLDMLFDHAGKHGSVALTLEAGSCLQSQWPGVIMQRVDIARAKTTLRMICARLAVRCAKWSKRPIAPYGDVVEFVFPPTHQQFKVRFENTTSVQEIVIELQSGNGTPKKA